MRFLRIGAQIAVYALVFDLTAALVGVVAHMLTSWWSLPMTEHLLAWTGVPGDMQPTTIIPYLFVLQPALMAGAWVAAASTPNLHNWRFLLASAMLVWPLDQLLGLVAFWEARVSPIRGQPDHALVYLAQEQALILGLALSLPAVLIATGHAILWLRARRAKACQEPAPDVSAN